MFIFSNKEKSRKIVLAPNKKKILKNTINQNSSIFSQPKNLKICIFWFISKVLPQILSQSYLALSISWSFFTCLGNYPHKIFCLFKPSIWTYSKYNFDWFIGFYRWCWFPSGWGKVRISILSIEWQLGLSPKNYIVIVERKYIFYRPRQATSWFKWWQHGKFSKATINDFM